MNAKRTSLLRVIWHVCLSANVVLIRELKMNFRSGRVLKVRLIATVVAALCSSIAHSAFAAQGSAPVTVVNTPTNPVPVTASTPLPVSGAVSISGTSNVNVTNATVPIAGTVSATQAGTWNVGISGTAFVQDPNAPGKNPYQHWFGFNPGPNYCPNDFYCVVTFPPVPAGKRLVVTHVSAQYSLISGGAEASVSVGINAVLGTTLDLPAPVAIAKDRYLASSPVMFFVEAGNSPSVFLAGGNVQPVVNSAWASIVGYLVSLP